MTDKKEKSSKAKKSKVTILKNCCDLEGNQLKKGAQEEISAKSLEALKKVKAVK